MTGIETIPLRIPEEWDPKWFEVFVRDVLALSDIRNAEGIGISITGTSDIVATLEGAGTSATFVVITPNDELTTERVLAIEAAVLSLTDNGPNSTVVIGVAEKGISYAKIQDITATDKLLGRSTAGAGVIEEIALTAAGRALIDDANAAAQRTTLDVDQAGTDNSTDVTLAGTPDYITIVGQVITRGLIDLTTDVTGDLPVAEGGTGSSTADDARTALSAAARTQLQDYNFFIDIQGGNDEYVIFDDISHGLEIESLNACLLIGGITPTATVTLEINTTTVAGISVSADTTKQTTADPSTSASTMVATDELSVVIAAQSGDPVSISGVIHFTRTLD